MASILSRPQCVNQPISLKCVSSILQQATTSSGNGLVPNRQQAIIQTNDDIVYWRIYASFVTLILKQTRQIGFPNQMPLGYRQRISTPREDR